MQNIVNFILYEDRNAFEVIIIYIEVACLEASVTRKTSSWSYLINSSRKQKQGDFLH